MEERIRDNTQQRRLAQQKTVPAAQRDSLVFTRGSSAGEACPRRCSRLASRTFEAARCGRSVAARPIAISLSRRVVATRNSRTWGLAARARARRRLVRPPRPRPLPWNRASGSGRHPLAIPRGLLRIDALSRSGALPSPFSRSRCPRNITRHVRPPSPTQPSTLQRTVPPSPTTSPAPSCASSLKTSSSYSKLSLRSSISSITTMQTTISANTRTDMFEQVRPFNVRFGAAAHCRLLTTSCSPDSRRKASAALWRRRPASSRNRRRP